MKLLSRIEIQKQRRGINPQWLDDMIDTINKLIDKIEDLEEKLRKT